MPDNRDTIYGWRAYPIPTEKPPNREIATLSPTKWPRMKANNEKMQMKFIACAT